MEIKINVKWLIAAIVLIAGISIAASYPTITATELFIRYVHADCSNCSNLPAAQIVGNFTQPLNFSSTLTASGLSLATAPDDALCIDPTTFKIVRNEGLTSCAASSKALKENIRNLEPQDASPDKFALLRPVRFNFKGDNKERIGLIAQEIEALYPEAIGYGKNGEVRGINYEMLVPVLIEKLQQQDKTNNDLSIKINELQQEIQNLGAGKNLTALPVKPAWWEFWK